MALTAASRPLTAVTPAMTSPTRQAPSKSPPPTSANMTDAPSILAGSAMSPNSSRWALYLARTSAALSADLQLRDESGELGLAVAVLGHERVGQEVETQGIDHEVLDRIVDPILRREHGETP